MPLPLCGLAGCSLDFMLITLIRPSSRACSAIIMPEEAKRHGDRGGANLSGIGQVLSAAGQAACPHSCPAAAGVEAACVAWTGSSAAIGISKAAATHNRLPAMNSILLIVCPFPLREVPRWRLSSISRATWRKAQVSAIFGAVRSPGLSGAEQFLSADVRLGTIIVCRTPHLL